MLLCDAHHPLIVRLAFIRRPRPVQNALGADHRRSLLYKRPGGVIMANNAPPGFPGKGSVQILDQDMQRPVAVHIDAVGRVLPAGVRAVKVQLRATWHVVEGDLLEVVQWEGVLDGPVVGDRGDSVTTGVDAREVGESDVREEGSPTNRRVKHLLRRRGNLLQK
jgi:hypothetical protein